MKNLWQEDMKKVEETLAEIKEQIDFYYDMPGRYFEDFEQILTDADKMAASLRNRTNRLKERIAHDKAI